MSEMPWNEAYEAIEPYVVRIATRVCFATVRPSPATGDLTEWPWPVLRQDLSGDVPAR